MSTRLIHTSGPRLVALLAVLAGLCLLPAVAHAAGPGSSPGQLVALRFTVSDAPGAPPRTATLRCLGTRMSATGYLSGAPAEACERVRRLATFLAGAPDPDRICTQVFAGPEMAAVRGVIGGRLVRRAFSRRNGCEIADWDRMGSLLGLGTIGPGERLVDYQRTGGIAGLDDRLTVLRTGLAVRTQRGSQPRVFHVPPDDLADLRVALAAADFPSLAPSYLPPVPIPDAFSYEIRHQGRTVVTTDGAVPARLEHAIAVLNRLLLPSCADRACATPSGRSTQDVARGAPNR